MLTIAGHKLYAPKGIGVLYVRDGTSLTPLIEGAGHEQGRRAGTENVASAVALGAACDIAAADLAAPNSGPLGDGRDSIRAVRDHFHGLLREAFGDAVVLNGHPTERLVNTLNVSFVDRFGGDIMAGLEGVAASTGAACHDGSRKLSAVLAAMKVPARIGLGAIRFSTGRHTTRAQVEQVAAQLRANLLAANTS
jgi:cysteine desulfurase